MVPDVRLELITPDNYDAALALKVRPDQEDLVEPVVKSLAEAYVYGDLAWPRLIYDADRPVGFLMAFLDVPWSTEPSPRSGLWRLNIAADVQGRGYGSFAVAQVGELLKARSISRMYVTWEPRPGGPETFYRKLGFHPTGELSEGQTVGVLDLGDGR